MNYINNFLAHMIEREASDLHLASGVPPTLRIHGSLVPMDYPDLSEEQVRALLIQIAPDHVRARIEAGETLTFGYEMHDPVRGRFRINVFPERRGFSAAIRFIRSTPPTLEDLGLPPIVPQFTQGNHGIVVICGATGSGKSTTLAACINEINQRENKHILTLEDPIEYMFENARSLVHQREIGVHAPSFNDGIIEALRQDPDVIVIGEVRGQEEIRRALLAAETGHLVFTTLHASSAEKAIARLVSVFPPGEQPMIQIVLSETIRCIAAQRLIPTKDGAGRVAAVELLVRNNAVASLIREGKTHQLYSVMQSSAKHGMITMNESLARLVRDNLIDKNEALAQANDPDELKRLLGGSWR